MKTFLIALGALAGALLLAVLAVLLFVDGDSLKPRVEAAASAALGMEVSVEGGLRIGFVPGLRLGLAKVRVRNRGSELLYAEEADLAVRFLPLLRKEIRYESIALDRARLSVERGKDGRYTFEGPAGKPVPFRGVELQRVSFTELAIAYADKLSGGGLEARGCHGELSDVRHPGGAPFLMRLSLSGQFECGEVRGAGVSATELKLPVAARDGVFDFKPFTMRLFGGQGKGSLRMDHSAAVPAHHLEFSLAKFRMEQVAKVLPQGRSVSGVMDFSAALAMRGHTRDELARSTAGDVSLSGSNLTLVGMDVDAKYAKYATSQAFDLIDVAALLLAGPVGLAVTKGYDFSSIAQAPGGSTQVRTVVSRWKVEKGVAHARDAALTTRHNRLALTGSLDFVNEEFDEVFVALVDGKGCAKVIQRIRGPFAKPIVEKASMFAALTGPVKNLLGRAADLLPGKDASCEVFYKGSLAHP